MNGKTIIPSERVKATFWNRYTEAENGCWIWNDFCPKPGYGILIDKGRRIKAHRMAYTLAKGDPGSLCVCHHCDTPRCINPEHLFLGTYLENNADRDKKNRQASGERIAFSILTKEKVIRIRKLANSISQTKIAKLFGVSIPAVNNIVLRRNWRHI